VSRSLLATASPAEVSLVRAAPFASKPSRRRGASLPADADLRRAGAIAARSPWTYANLVLRADKHVLFSTAGDAFLMYGRHGRSWIAMGDPVGAEPGVAELVRSFRELCRRRRGRCVFFEVRPARRRLYEDVGLALTPLGEQARVDLTAFSLDVPALKAVRQARASAVRRGCTFEIVPPPGVPPLLPALARVSAAWLARKSTREKGFSNASFDGAYLAHFPVAVVRRGGEIVAFANLWLGAGHEELSVDLMRHAPDAPAGTMDFLFAGLLAWGRTDGYRWFDLGMAPLAGLAASEAAPVWRFVGTMIYRHGEHFYNFAGLRRFKAKFAPVWTPLYLASPRGLALPLALIDVTALIAGGVAGILSKGGARA
jgi:phosphatidylglycerol lysyltransferase